MFDREGFSRRMKERRQSIGYSQDMLAKAAGISSQAVCAYEKGERMPNAEFLAAIATALDCSVDWLLGLTKSRLIDQQQVCEITGLAPDAVEWLSSCPIDSMRAMMAHFLDIVITSGELLNLALAFWQWERARGELVEVQPLKDQADKILSGYSLTVPEMGKVMEDHPEIFEVLENAELRVDAEQYRMEDTFRRFLAAVREKKPHGHD